MTYEFETELEEGGWKQSAAALAAAGALAMGGAGYNSYKKHEVTPNAQATQVQPTQLAKQYKAPTKLSIKDRLIQVATDAGMEGKELAQFIAQCAHETLNFTRMIEHGTSSYFMHKYDPTKNRQKAKILGNTKAGDGVRFRGRGYIQLTGRWNYTAAGKALGLPLAEKPELAARPDVAAKVAVWYWNERVRPNVKDFGNVAKVTKQINPNLRGLKSRVNQYQQYADQDM